MLYCGIDISKTTFDVAVFNQVNYKSTQFENNSSGIKLFLRWMKSLDKPAIYCMEATGIYYLQLAKALYAKGLKVIVVNPIKTHGFSKMEMQRNKTDSIDAQMIARFCHHLYTQGQAESLLFKPKSKQIERLTSLVNRREQLLLLRTEENNRKKVTEDPISLKSIKRVIKIIDQEVVLIESELNQMQIEHPEIDRQVKLLLSIDGIGQITAWTILAYLGDINRYSNSKKVASYVGLSPRKIESGSSLNKSRLSKLGHKKLRKALYFPAIVACKHNPTLKQKYDDMVSNGKTKKTAICAVMRKLLIIAYGVLKSKQEFDPNYGKTI